MARILDGRALARRLNGALARRVAQMPRPPGIAVVLVGNDPASELYVRRKGVVAGRVGIVHRQIDLPATVSRGHLERVVRELNDDPAIDGILVQLPLPPQIPPLALLDHISPAKDVDGFCAVNCGRLSQGRPGLVSCTPLGIMRLLEHSGVPLAGREAVVIGRSNIVGRPMAMLLEQANCTVTICHRHTRDLASAVRRAEVLVAAAGAPGLVRGEWVREGSVIVDVGMNRAQDGSLVGDVDFDEAAERAGAITPVPGGVGPMTIAMLMENTWRASCRAQGIRPEDLDPGVERPKPGSDC